MLLLLLLGGMIIVFDVVGEFEAEAVKVKKVGLVGGCGRLAVVRVGVVADEEGDDWVGGGKWVDGRSSGF